MTKKSFLECIDNIDDKFIRETEEDMRKREEGQITHPRFSLPAALGTAACAAAALIIGVTAVSYYNDRSPVLSVSDSTSVSSVTSAVSDSDGTPQDTVLSGGHTGLETLSDTAKAEISSLRENSTGKLDFSDAELTLPDITGDLYQLRVTPTPTMSNSELLELFGKSVKRIFPDSSMTDDIDNYFWERYSFMPFTDEYIKRIQSGDIQLKRVLYDTKQNKNNETADNEYLLMDTSGAIVLWRGDYDAQYFYPFGYLNITDRYILSGAAIPGDGNEEVCKAAAFCDEYFSNTLSFTELSNAKRLSSEVAIADDGSYVVTLARSFNGVLFDTLAVSHVIVSDDRREFTYPQTDGASAVISADGELLYALVDSYNDILTPEGEKIESIISLERAAELVEQKFKFKTDDFSVEDVSLVYFDLGAPHYVKYPADRSTARLNWRFTVLGEDKHGKVKQYYVYVDALNEIVVVDTCEVSDN